MIVIKNVQFLDNYIIKFSLIDNSEIFHDMKPKVSSARFIKLQDPDLFAAGKLVNSNHIEWENDICIYDYEVVNIKNFINKYMAED